MSAKFEESNFRDSDTTRFKIDLSKFNHVIDGAGENVQYHSDSESFCTKTSKRYINPAICVEKVESAHSASIINDSSYEMTPHPHGSCRSNSTPYLSAKEDFSVKRFSCHLDYDLEERYIPLNRTYREEHGSDTFRLSVASLSTTTTAKEDNEQCRKENFEQWLARKEQERKDKARLNKLREQPPKIISEQERERSYQSWLAQKRMESERRKDQVNTQQYREKERLERERAKAEREKQKKMAEWKLKKEEDMKVMKTREERIAARMAMENEKRKVSGERAYRDWLRSSKNKPLPVPLNQGELSMRGSVSDMYINPVPWKSLI